MFKLNKARALIGALSLAAASMAHAAVDVTALDGAKTDIGLVGAAVFVVAVAIAITKWVRRAL